MNDANTPAQRKPQCSAGRWGTISAGTPAMPAASAPRRRLRSVARHLLAVSADPTAVEQETELLHAVGQIQKVGATQGAVRVPAQLAAADRAAYERDGFVLVKGVFTPKECDDWVAYAKEQMAKQVEALAADDKKPLPARPREPGTTDPEMDMLLHPKIRDALSGCMDADGWPEAEPVAIQSMYFWQGSEQRRHQDQFYLPECMSAWTAFEDVSPRNGTVWAQAGSHKGRLLTREDFLEGGEFHGVDYNDAVDAVYDANEAAGMVEKPIIAEKGDVLYFHGVLVHRGGEILERGSSRHVYANHYVPSSFDGDQPDRRGAGSAAQYDNWERGGLGRLSFADVHPSTERPTSLSFGVLPDGSGRAFLRQDKFEEDGEGVKQERIIPADDATTFARRQAAKKAAEEAAAAGIHESPGQKIKRQLGLKD
jgi:phytanoyl-CoA hydroxylase